MAASFENPRPTAEASEYLLRAPIVPLGGELIMSTRFISMIFVVAVSFFGLTVSAFADDTITVKNDQIVTKSFIGFGIEWNIDNYPASGITDEDFRLITERIQKMKLPIVRIMMLGKYCYLGNGKYNWNTDAMKFIYKQLDFCQRQGIKVILCSWGAGGTANTSWMNMPGITGVDDPKYAEVVGTFMDYLINTKGYSCIKYFSAGNEPDLEVNDWGKWKQGVIAIDANFKSRGLSKKFIFLGPETSQSSRSESWLKDSNSQLSHIIGAFGMHYYASRDLVKAGNLESLFIRSRNSVSSTSSSTSAAPFFVSEAGMSDDQNPPYGNPHVNEFDYGVFMADYALQGARSGAASVLAWMLDDSSHKGHFSGLWTNKADGMKIRPWYTPWALLSKYFQSGSTLYRVDQPTSMRILAARTPGKSDPRSVDYSFCLVNRDSISRNIRISIPTARSESKSFNRFIYTQAADANNTNYPYLATASETINLKREFTVTCPPNSVTVLSSM